MSTRLEFLSRRNQGRRLIAEYLQSLSKITGIATNTLKSSVLDLDKSDPIREGFILNITLINNKNFAGVHVKELFSESCDLMNKIINLLDFIQKDKKFYLVTNLSENCGLIEFDFNKIMPYFEEIIDYDKDYFGLVSVDLKSGVMVDSYLAPDDKQLYEVVAYSLD